MMSKTTLALSLSALLTLTACGGSSGSDQVNHDHHDDHKCGTAGQPKCDGMDNNHPDNGNQMAYPQGKKFVGVTESGMDGKQTTMGSDNLYTVLVNGQEVNIGDAKVYGSTADIITTGFQMGQGFSGAVFSKGMLSYATFGAVADYDMSTHQLSNYRPFFQGQATPVEAVPTDGKVLYRGRAIQQYADDKPDLAKGQMTAAVDFAAKKLDIKLMDIKIPASINGANISGNRFSGMQNGVMWSGGFFGDKAAEIAGFAKQDGAWAAEFGGVPIANTDK